MGKGKELYASIMEIVEKQRADNATITRSDLAAILQSKYKIDIQDGAALSEAVYGAYKAYGDSPLIRSTVVSNNEGASVVEMHELNVSLDDGNHSQALSLVRSDLHKADAAIESAQKEVRTVLDVDSISLSIAKELSGYGDIERIQSKGAVLMQNYGKMVGEYQTAEDCVKTDVRDFLLLRSSINSKFLQYSSALVDIFGDSIKVIAPNLFDFNSIKWLDVKLMQSDRQLQFDKLDENCTLLIGEIADHFQKTMSSVPVWMKSSKALGKGGVYGGLVAAAFSFLNHYLDAAAKTTQMERELLKFEDSIVKDRMLIQSDLMRVAAIHKTMNDVYIPQADAFLRYCDQLMTDDLENILENIYTDESKSLKSQRDEILNRLKSLEQSINDHNEWIHFFSNLIADRNGLLTAKKDLYDKAMKEKPAEPSFVGKLFGTKGYEKKLYEWDKNNGVLVDAYEETKADVYEAEQDLKSHRDSLERDKREYDDLKVKLSKINKKIAENLVCAGKQKLVVLKHLKNLITMLHAGKSVLENRLDESLLNVRTIKEIEYQLPKHVENQLNSFVNDTCATLEKNGESISHSVLKELDLEGVMTPEQTKCVQEAVAKASEILRNFSYLQSEQIKSQLTREAYNEEFEKLKSEFQRTMAQIDKKSAVVMQAVQRANNSTNKEDLRKALLALTNQRESDLTENDFDMMLRGEKSIEI